MKYEVEIKISYSKTVEVEATSKENAITLAKSRVLTSPFFYKPEEEDVLTLACPKQPTLKEDDVTDDTNDDTTDVDDEVEESFDDEGM